MWWKSLTVLIAFVVITISGNFALAACPSTDLTDDCFVNFEDFAVMANQWPSGYDLEDIAKMTNQWLTTDPNVPDDMAYIPEGEFDMGDHHGDGYSDELPVHAVLLDSFFMSRYEITNSQYCDYLNDAKSLGRIKVVSGIVYASSDSSNSYPYCDTHSSSTYSQIDYLGGVFRVRTKFVRDMSDDPMVEVSWYGSVAYCNWRSSEEGKESCYNLSTWDCDFSKQGYRLATEAEWEYAARGGEHAPYFRFPWGDPISPSQANYYSYWVGGIPYYSYDVSPTEGHHPAYNDVISPFTAPAGSFSANGYGLYCMAGNVWEWCNDWYDSNYYNVSPYDNPQGPSSNLSRVLRGGGWDSIANYCRLGARIGYGPISRYYSFGFRVVLDSN